MKLEDHPGYQPSLSCGWPPLFIFADRVFGSWISGADFKGLAIFDNRGHFQGIVMSNGYKSGTAKKWFDQTFTAEDQRTIWALAQLHR